MLTGNYVNNKNVLQNEVEHIHGEILQYFTLASPDRSK